MSNWGTYSDEHYLYYDGWHIWTVQFHLMDGSRYYRWCKSKHRQQTDKWALWQDKNPKARKPANKFYLTRFDALVAAKESCR